MKFGILWSFDALVALVFVYFFFVGLADGSVSSFDIGIWLIILGILAAVLGGSYFARAKGQILSAIGILCLLAIPALGGRLLFLGILISNPHWN